MNDQKTDIAPQPDVSGKLERTQLAAAIAIAAQAGGKIAAKFRALGPRERRSIVTAFRREVIPPGKPGRERRKEITAAYMDWKAGMCGVELYRKHLLRYDRMGHWERKVKTRALMDAIRARKRRDEDKGGSVATSD